MNDSLKQEEKDWLIKIMNCPTKDKGQSPEEFAKNDNLKK